MVKANPEALGLNFLWKGRRITTSLSMDLEGDLEEEMATMLEAQMWAEQLEEQGPGFRNLTEAEQLDLIWAQREVARNNERLERIAWLIARRKARIGLRTSK